ncbi:hypothetical protein [Alicyclobacillus ferrooxydans]|uniref:Uncharacterized protein n=1 Tax=Alicyclobacillus ferrooxydans TaxID=471514 RepID=A0A0P9CIP9_9BACL|nr:hypothetical protein [Alicyclobacillus ferrooxydans]KPV45282.1 hypothetical protein AN477_02580 [Alicyclobacillus ferrooxydans]
MLRRFSVYAITMCILGVLFATSLLLKVDHASAQPAPAPVTTAPVNNEGFAATHHEIRPAATHDLVNPAHSRE